MFSRRSFLGGAAASALSAQPKRGLKIFIHWDMEGAGGIFTREQAWYKENGVRPQVAAEALELLTAGVNAASRAALEAGAGELIVCDTHGGGGNFIKEKLLQDQRITYLYRSVGLENGKRRWMPGMNETVDGLMLMGHHAKAGTPGAFLPHAQTRAWLDFSINGQSVGEIGIESCYAGHWNVPLILVQGDEAACAETRQQFPGTVTAAVKRGGENFEVCTGLDPEAAHRETARRIAEAFAGLRAGKMRPYKPSLPMTLRLRVNTVELAAKMAQRPGVSRIDDHTLEGRVGRQADVMQWITGTGLDMGE